MKQTWEDKERDSQRHEDGKTSSLFLCRSFFPINKKLCDEQVGKERSERRRLG